MKANIIFFRPHMCWDPSKDHYGLSEETGGSNPRTTEELCDDLMDLLNTFAGYLSHSHLTEKIL